MQKHSCSDLPVTMSWHATSSPNMEALNNVVKFLQDEGLHEAEVALLKEMAKRFSEHNHPRSNLVGMSPGGSSTSPGAECTVNLCPAPTPTTAVTAERVLQEWRSKSTTPAGSPKKHTLTSPSSQDLDEYDDEDDPGYYRMDIAGQEGALGLEAGRPPPMSPSQSSAGLRAESNVSHSRQSSLGYNHELYGSRPGSSLSHEFSGKMRFYGNYDDVLEKRERFGQDKATGGTAEWVYGNSVGSDLYKSLLQHLDGGSSPMGGASCSSNAATPSPSANISAPCTKEERVLSRVSSLSESVLQEGLPVDGNESLMLTLPSKVPHLDRTELGLSVHTNETTAAECGSGPDQDDPFSFPVTPSEHAALEGKPLFSSWASFKNISPSKKADSDEEPSKSTIRTELQKTMRSASQASLGRATTPDASQDWDPDSFHHQYEVLTLKVVHPRHATGFEDSREASLRVGDVIAARYRVTDLLGQAAFSRAVQAEDLSSGTHVCLKIIKNNKDYFDQSLDEIKLLQYVNACDPGDEHGILRLHDFFYYREHLVLVCELLRANLYEFSRHLKESNSEPYFTAPRMKLVAKQLLTSLAFLHSLDLIHADLKPENILMKSYSGCEVKLIDLGSSCFVTDKLNVYIQSRSYRAPEVILGLQYDQKIDIWSLGCVLIELWTGKVLLQNESLPTLLARLESIFGPTPPWMVRRGRFSHRFFTRDCKIFERNPDSGRLEWLRPKRTSLAARAVAADNEMLDFLSYLLQVDPQRRPSAEEALQHPWLHSQPSSEQTPVVIGEAPSLY